MKQEKWAAILIGVAASFNLCGYEFVRSPSNTLYKSVYGAENLPVVMAFLPLAVILAVAVYGRVLSALGARRTLLASSLFSAFALLASYLLYNAGFGWATVLLYLVREVYVTLLIEQYWSFINSRLSTQGGKKFNGMIAGIASIGAVTGGILVSKLAEPVGTAQLLIFGAVSLLPAAYFSNLAFRYCGEPKPSSAEAGGKQGHLGWHSFKQHRTLIYILLVVVMSQVISANVMMMFQDILEKVLPDNDQQTAFSGEFFAWVNGVAGFFQFIVTPLALRFISLRLIHIAIPSVQLLAIGAYWFRPELATAGAAYLIFKALDYSVFRASKELLYIPFPFDARYRAKEVIDVFGYRASKGVASLAIVGLQKVGGLGSGVYTTLAATAATCWLLFSVPMTRSQRELPDR